MDLIELGGNYIFLSGLVNKEVKKEAAWATPPQPEGTFCFRDDLRLVLMEFLAGEEGQKNKEKKG